MAFIASREDAEVTKSIIDKLLSTPSTIETSLLQKCIENRSIEFRRVVASELLRRDAIGSEQAKLLLESADAGTRVIGAKALSKRLLDFSLADAQSAIVKTKRQVGLALEIDYDGQKQFEKYKHAILYQKSYDDLSIMRENENIYKYDISFAMYDRYFSKMRTELLQNLDDEFRGFFSKKRQEMIDSSLLPDEKVETFIRETVLHKGISLLCSKQISVDLPLVRKIVDNANVPFSTEIVQFLGKFGAWDDVKRIIELCSDFPFEGVSLASYGGHDQDYATAAKVMLALAEGRVADLLAKEMPSPLKRAIFQAMSKNLFRSFDNVQIEKWLGTQNESVRKTVALKTVLSLPKSRIEEILTSYMGDGKTYFYNAVFWLDLGISADKRRAVAVAERILKST